MKSGIGRESGIALVVTLCVTLILAIGAVAFLYLTKTQIVQVRSQSHSTKAFFAAEVGMEKGIELLRNDFYYTPEGVDRSWADAEVYTATGYIDLTQGGQITLPKCLDLENPDYEGEFYPLVGETDYDSWGDGGHKLTYQIDISNYAYAAGAPPSDDRIWVKATGRYYRKNDSGDGFIPEAETRVLAQVKGTEISVWNNAVFAGEGLQEGVISGNAEICGSVHILGTSLGENELALDLGGGGSVRNNYSGIPQVLFDRIPLIEKSYGGETVESLEAEVRIQHGKISLSGGACVGEPDVPGNGVKETMDGVYVTDGYAGDSEQSVYSDNGTNNPYDLLEELVVSFPRLSDPYEGYPSYLDYLRANALVISDSQQLNQMRNIDATSVFDYSDSNGQIKMDGNGLLTIRGIVVVEGDVEFDKAGSEKIIEYTGTGTLVSATNVGINCNLITSGFSTFPKDDILGVMAADTLTFSTAQINVMGIFYAENKGFCEKQTSIAGAVCSSYLDMGNNVPSIYQVPEIVENLPPGMIGGTRVWALRRLTWGEIGS